jgi:hypothetical protein
MCFDLHGGHRIVHLSDLGVFYNYTWLDGVRCCLRNFCGQLFCDMVRYDTRIQTNNPAADATIIFSTIAFGRGVGNVVSGPFSEALIQADSWQGHAAGAYGSGFGLLIVCTGLTAIMGGLSLMARCLRCI